MIILYCLLVALSLFALSTVFYRCVNKGLSSSARHQQLTRFAIASMIAVAPLAVSGSFHFDGCLVLAALTSVSFSVTYPMLFHLGNRKVSPDYDNYMDIPVGMYLFALLSSLIIVSGVLPLVVVTLIEWCILFIVISQWVYFALYRTCIDTNGMKILQETHYNEIIEFARSYPVWVTVVVTFVIIAAAVGTALVNFAQGMAVTESWWVIVGEYIVAMVVVVLTFKGKRSPFVRSGVVALWRTVREYSETNNRYAEHRAERLKSLAVRQLGEKWDKPSTIVMVIGESASRDFMSAFTSLDRQTTPWLDRLAADTRHCILFPNVYASAMHTVAVLEKSLTECSQYNDKTFYESCSIVDVAHALGYRVHWYSNQGHLGAADTPVTLVAETSDVAKWTKQELNKVQYDMSLLDFLDEVDPDVNNLLVLHLKGSHFNFLNRYPRECTVWGEPGVQDNEVNYMNSIRYTDSFLERVFDYCSCRLNMQAMLYFSDHATIPSRRRTPGFDGFGHVRIPMFTWFSDEYIARHPVPYSALRNNRERYFTNDLVYDLMCGLLDVESNRYDPAESLASDRYRYTRDMLLTFEGKIRIADDPDDSEAV